MTAPRSAAGSVPLLVGAVAVAALIVAVGLTLRTEGLAPTAPTPDPGRAVPEAGTDVRLDLTTALPPEAEERAGGWRADGQGATVAEAAPYPANPLLEVPVDGPPWATVTVTGQVAEGWSVAFAVESPTTYWAISLLPGSGVAQLLRVVDGVPASVTPRPLPADARAVVRIRFLGHQVQVEAAGVALPTVTVGGRATPSVALLGRGPAAEPGGARWTSIEVVAEQPLPPPDLPPILGARSATADEVRRALVGPG